MAEVLRFHDPDASGLDNGSSRVNAYETLSGWESGEQTNLVSDGDTHRLVVLSSAGSASAGAAIAGWTTGPADFITVEADTDQEALATGIDTARFRTSSLLSASVGYIRFKGLQIDPGSGNGMSFNFASSADLRVDNCYLSGAGGQIGLLVEAAFTETITIQNTIAHDWFDGVVINGGTANIYNYIGAHGSDGIELNNAAVATITNVACFDNADDFDIAGTATATIDHCASDDGDGTNAVAPSGADWDNEYTDPANGDYTPLDSGNVFHGGIAVSGLTLDMAGETWNDPPTIGVLEIVSAGTAFFRSVADSIGLTDSLSRVGTFSRAITDGEGITDTTTRAGTFLRAVADAVGLTDVITSTLIKVVSIADAVGITDSATAAGAFIRAIADLAGVTDATTRTGTFSRTIEETEGVTDTTSRAAGLLRSISDTLGITDALAAAKVTGAKFAAIFDSVGVTDTLSRTGTFFRSVLDIVAPLDVVATARRIIVTIISSLGISDLLSGRKPGVIDGPLIITIASAQADIDVTASAATISISGKSGTIEITQEI